MRDPLAKNPYSAFDNATGSLPESVQRWLGATEGDPVLALPEELAERLGERYEYASLLNDDHRLTFAQIADCFEATLAAQEDA